MSAEEGCRGLGRVLPRLDWFGRTPKGFSRVSPAGGAHCVQLSYFHLWSRFFEFLQGVSELYWNIPSSMCACFELGEGWRVQVCLEVELPEPSTFLISQGPFLSFVRVAELIQSTPRTYVSTQGASYSC